MKRTGIHILLTCLTVLLLSHPARALDLVGHLTRGGMATGRVDPATQVSYDGKKVRVSPEGVFVIGFDRDAPLKTVLRLRYQDGSVDEHAVTITGRDYNIQRIDGLPPRKVDPEPEDLKRIRADAALVTAARKRDDPRTGFLQDFIWPVTGRITGVYGSQRVLNGKPKRPHYGVDIAAPQGTPVRAPADGVVTLAHPDMFYSGGTLILDHGHGISSSFLHLHKILVQEGEPVRQGDIIAEVGATGRVTGAHLDWRMNWFDRRIDPTLLVPPMSEARKP